MKTNEKHPIGRELTQFGDKLTQSELDNPSQPGTWKKIDCLSGLLGGVDDFSKANRENLEKIKNYLLGGFDVAITALTILNALLFFLPNFFNLVVTYISQLIYNALDAYLRLGMHLLIVPPNFTDRNHKGFPTTSLEEQAKNVYKKFYDTSDPFLPYNVPLEKGISEQLIEGGRKYQNKIEKFMLKRSPFDDQQTLSENWFGIADNKTLASDFIDYEQSVKNLSRPLGVYDAIFLYFSVDYKGMNQHTFIQFLDSLASLANLMQLESLSGLHDDFESLWHRPLRQKISVLMNQQLIDMPKDKDLKIEKIDSKTRKQIVRDKALEEYVIIEADPSDNIPKERYEKLKEFVEDEVLQTEGVLLEGQMTQGREAILTIEEELRNKSYMWKMKKENYENQKVQFSFYFSKHVIAELFQGADWSNSESIKSIATNSSILNEARELSKKDDFSVGHEMSVVKEVFVLIDEMKSALVGEEGSFIAESQTRSIVNQLKEKTEQLSQTWRNAEDIADITPPEIKNQENLSALEEYEKDFEEYNELLRKEAVEIYERQVSKLTDAVKEKKKQLSEIEKKMDSNYVPNNLLNETSSQIVYYHRSYKHSNRNLFSNHLKNFYQETNHKDPWNFLYDLYTGTSTEIPKFLPTESFVYDFSIERSGLSLNRIQPGMYVHIYRKNKAYAGGVSSGASNFEFIGDGFVTDSKNLSQKEGGGEGNWLGINFSDLIGTTSLIKALQRKVKAFQNMFTPNDTFLTEMIKFLKKIRERILELIEIIDSILKLLSLTLEFTGTTYGKYVRENDSDYDLLAANLTSTQGYTGKRHKKNFKPSNHSTIQYWLRRIAEIDQTEADRIRIEIDAEYKDTDDDWAVERRKKASENSQQPSLVPDTVTPSYITQLFDTVIKDYGMSHSVFEQAQKVKEFIVNEVESTLSTGTGTYDLGSALFTDVTKMEFVDEEIVKKGRQNNKIKLYKAELYSALFEIEKTLSSEFGFSMVFLSYLPKGLDFYPVRWLAEQWNLIDQNGVKPETPPLEKLDPNKIKDLMVELNQQELEDILAKTSEQTSPMGGVKQKPDPIIIDWVSHRVTESTNFTYMEPTSLSPLYFEEIPAGSDFMFRIKKPLSRNLHGVRSKDVLEIPAQESPNDVFVFQYEFELQVELDLAVVSALNLGIREIPKINKIDIHAGVFYKSAKFDNYEKAYELNAETDNILNFGNRKKKKFKCNLVGIQKNQIEKLQPYILIGYSPPSALAAAKNSINTDIDMSSVTFRIINSQIYFYRTR